MLSAVLYLRFWQTSVLFALEACQCCLMSLQQICSSRCVVLQYQSGFELCFLTFLLSCDAPSADTRFVTAFIMLERLVEVKQSLEETVVARDWKDWLERQSAALRDEADDVKSTVSFQSLEAEHLGEHATAH
jgi:hypothetical protein